MDKWLDGQWMQWSRLQFSRLGPRLSQGLIRKWRVSGFERKILQEGEQMGCGWQESEDRDDTGLLAADPGRQ